MRSTVRLILLAALVAAASLTGCSNGPADTSRADAGVIKARLAGANNADKPLFGVDEAQTISQRAAAILKGNPSARAYASEPQVLRLHPSLSLPQDAKGGTLSWLAAYGNKDAGMVWALYDNGIEVQETWPAPDAFDLDLEGARLVQEIGSTGEPTRAMLNATPGVAALGAADGSTPSAVRWKRENLITTIYGRGVSLDDLLWVARSIRTQTP